MCIWIACTAIFVCEGVSNLAHIDHATPACIHGCAYIWKYMCMCWLNADKHPTLYLSLTFPYLTFLTTLLGALSTSGLRRPFDTSFVPHPFLSFLISFPRFYDLFPSIFKLHWLLLVHFTKSLQCNIHCIVQSSLALLSLIIPLCGEYLFQ